MTSCCWGAQQLRRLQQTGLLKLTDAWEKNMVLVVYIVIAILIIIIIAIINIIIIVILSFIILIIFYYI
jgi:hypothetical protein